MSKYTDWQLSELKRLWKEIFNKQDDSNTTHKGDLMKIIIIVICLTIGLTGCEHKREADVVGPSSYWDNHRGPNTYPEEDFEPGIAPAKGGK